MTYGRLYLNGNGTWYVEAQPHVLLRLKRVFERVPKGAFGRVPLANTPENCRDLLWFMDRYPLQVEDAAALTAGAKAFTDRSNRLAAILSPGYKPTTASLALPLRQYQAVARDYYLANGHLLLADDVGLGKTAVAIGSFTDKRTLPAVVVTQTFLTRQWQAEINKFAPKLHAHILKKGTPYELPSFFGQGPDVLIMTYHKLQGWAHELGEFAKSIVFDEVQALRRNESNRYDAAKYLSRCVDFRLGLSATPIYNYGGEFYNVASILRPDCLGTRGEFLREWTNNWGRKPSLNEPRAFGAHVRDIGLLMRRTRKDVGRELPTLTKVRHEIDSDARELHRVKSTATELARLILDRGAPKADRFNARGQFEMVMRQATGLAKAPFVADFVRMLVANGERVVLCGWHRAVYDVWADRLKDLRVVWFTGTESNTAKNLAKADMCNGHADVMLMSLRSGQGLDGLQHACRTMVFGELDWSPGIHEQCIGRLHRDGQPDPVTAYFLVADDGADPIMADVLGMKRTQVEGIKSPDRPLIEKLDRGGARVRELAEAYVRGLEGR